MEIATLILFCAVLFGCIAAGTPMLAALVAGYVIFFVYALIKGFSPIGILKMSFKGVRTVKNILITFMLIGIITALWRAGGTIPAIVHYASGIMEPGVFFLVTFLMNCLISVLTGTAFGTAATMGAICMTMAYTAGIDPIITGGAVVSGAFFGDRCSPVSTSALLVAQITGTNIYSNIVGMIKTVIVPFCITCVFYLVPGFILNSKGTEIQGVAGIFSEEFNITPIAVIPAVVILVLSLFRVNVKTNMLVSIAASVVVCIFCSEMSALEIIRCAFAGYFSSDPMIAKMIDGGGIVSMLRVTAIVCISSCYSGIFEGTGLLEPVKGMTGKAEKRISRYAVTMLTSVITSIVACNQTLAIMLTDQLCDHMEKDKKRFALYLENSAVVIAPLVPWSIAGSVPITSSGAPAVSLAAAVLLYLIPLCSLFIFRKNRTRDIS